MRNLRSYYSATIAEFLQQSSSEIIGIIHANDISAETTIQQSNTWESEVQILKDQLRSFRTAESFLNTRSPEWVSV